MLKRRDLSNIVDNKDALCSLIVGSCDGSKSLISSCIPYLELNGSVVELDVFNLKLNADGGYISM